MPSFLYCVGTMAGMQGIRLDTTHPVLSSWPTTSPLVTLVMTSLSIPDCKFALLGGRGAIAESHFGLF